MDLSEEEKQLIKQHRENKAKEDADAWKPRQLDSYTDAEKIAVFDRLHTMALDMFNQVKKDRWFDEDFSGYASEEIMHLLGKDVFSAAISEWI